MFHINNLNESPKPLPYSFIKAMHKVSKSAMYAISSEKLNLIRGYVSTGDFTVPISILQGISNWQTDAEVLYSLAFCYKMRGFYDAAISHYCQIPGWGTFNQILYEIGDCYRFKELFDSAIMTYQKIKRWDKTKKVIIAYMYCCNKIGKYEDALEVYRGFKNWEGTLADLMPLAMCYYHMKKFELAIPVFKSIPNWSGEESIVLLAGKGYESLGQPLNAIQVYSGFSGANPSEHILKLLALCYRREKLYTEAISVYNRIPSLFSNEKLLFELADSYRQIGYYDNQIITLQKISNFERKCEVLTLLASAYKWKGDYPRAIQIYKKRGGLDTPSDTTFCLAGCYREMGCHEKALSYYLKIHKKGKHLIFLLADCYMEMNRPLDAFKALEQLSNWKTDKEIQIRMARFHQELKQYQNAITIYKNIIDRGYEIDALTALGCCYAGMGHLQEAINCFKKLPFSVSLKHLSISYQNAGYHREALRIIQKNSLKDWRKEGKLLRVAECYEGMGNHPQAETHYRLIITQFPHYKDGFYRYCQYAIKRSLLNVEELINTFKKRFRYDYRGYTLLAQYQTEQKNITAAEKTLYQALKILPYATEIYVALIRFELFVKNNLSQAQRLQKDCHAKFDGNAKLFERIKNIILTRRLGNHWPWRYDVTESLTPVVLSSTVRAVFSSLESVNGECYVTGEEVLTSLENELVEPKKDNVIEMIVFLEEGTSFCVPGYENNAENTSLYRSRLQNTEVICYVLSNLKESMVENHALAQNFTIALLYCDKTGVVIDPSGTGLWDLKHKVLRTSTLPQKMFREYPHRLLEAIKYIVLGYKPHGELETAMKTWGGDLYLDRKHLQAVAKEHLLGLSTEGKLGYVEKLKNYNLLGKIFQIAPQNTDNETLMSLERQVGIHDTKDKNGYRYRLNLFENYTLRELNGSPINLSMRPREWDVFAAVTQTKRRLEALDLAEPRDAKNSGNLYLQRKPIREGVSSYKKT